MNLIHQAEYLRRLGRQLPPDPHAPTAEPKFAVFLPPTIACSRCKSVMKNELSTACDDLGRLYCDDCAVIVRDVPSAAELVLHLEAALHAILDDALDTANPPGRATSRSESGVIHVVPSQDMVFAGHGVARYSTEQVRIYAAPLIAAAKLVDRWHDGHVQPKRDPDAT